MASRPRAGRAAAGRDAGKDVDAEAELQSRILEALRKKKEFNDNSQRLGQEIIALEESIKAKGSKPSSAEIKALDDLYRENLKNSEAELADDESDLINNLAMLATLKTPDEPTARNGAVAKSRKAQRPAPAPAPEPDITVESPGPSPTETRSDVLKRVKNTAQRSSSVASSGRLASATIKSEENVEGIKGVEAEKAGLLVMNAEVFYKFPKGPNKEGEVGIQCLIKKVWHDKKPIQYEMLDPEPDPQGKPTVHKATARDLIPIPPAGAPSLTFPNGGNVFAKYPETDTFYNARVKGFHKGVYKLIFDGEEDDKEMSVDKRFVFTTARS